MALLDQVIGGLMGGGAGGNASPLQGVLMALLSGGGGNQAGAAGQGMAGQGMAGQGGLGGGIGGLLAAFQGAGLGNIAQSWVGHGPNQPVSPQQLQSVLGEQQVQNMADQTGMAPHDLLSQLSQHLPTAVDRMTPGGQVPNEGSVSV